MYWLCTCAGLTCWRYSRLAFHVAFVTWRLCYGVYSQRYTLLRPVRVHCIRFVVIPPVVLDSEREEVLHDSHSMEDRVWSRGCAESSTKCRTKGGGEHTGIGTGIYCAKCTK